MLDLGSPEDVLIGKNDDLISQETSVIICPEWPGFICSSLYCVWIKIVF